MLEFDAVGYPLAIAFNAVHLLTRFSVFTSKIPSWKEMTRVGDRLADADARLEYLRKQTGGTGGGWKPVNAASCHLLIDES